MYLEIHSNYLKYSLISNSSDGTYNFVSYPKAKDYYYQSVHPRKCLFNSILECLSQYVLMCFEHIYGCFHRHIYLVKEPHYCSKILSQGLKGNLSFVEVFYLELS